MPRFLIFLIALSAFLGFLFWHFPYAIKSGDDKASLLYSVLLLVLVAGGGIVHFKREQLPETLRNIALWLGIILVLMLGYSYRDVLLHNRIVAEFLPYRVQVGPGGSLSVRAGDYGHFYIEAQVNGVPVKFMVDTGASDVVLSPNDAARLGFKKSDLVFGRSYQTANGPVRGAAVVLDRIEVGPVSVAGMPASVNEADMDNSLLGMSFLKQFKSFRVGGNVLVLEP